MADMLNLVQKTDKIVCWNGQDFECCIGKNGFAKNKVEGDNKTPIGIFNFLHLYYRPDFITLPKTAIPCTAITPDMGWSDDVLDKKYNQLVTLPHDFSHEKMYRDDRIYDLVIVNSHNINPIIPEHGSAVFIHLMREEKTTTAGCLALTMEDMLKVIQEANMNSCWIVGEALA